MACRSGARFPIVLTYLATCLGVSVIAFGAKGADVVVTFEKAEGASGGTALTQQIEVTREYENVRLLWFEYWYRGKQETGRAMRLGRLGPPRLGAEVCPAKEGMVRRELHFVPPRLDHVPKRKFVARLGFSDPITSKVGTKANDEAVKAAETAMAWHDAPGKSLELRTSKGRPLLRYMYEAVDNSSKERRGETYKVYHHVFDPEGDRLLTKGPGGLFPHHRGLFYGFNKISYGDKQQADVWHCNHGEWQEHVKVISQEAGAEMGRHRVAVDWHGRDGKVFAKEERELTVYPIAAGAGAKGGPESPGTLIDFVSELTSTVGPLKLDGDPQHAGFQFRASQEVPDKTAKETYYLRPDGKGEPGKFRNWPQDKGHENLPWNALSFVIDGQRYTVVYLDHPKNPKPARYSERDYGRFGSYFVAELDEGKPLTVQYRVWVQRGEVTVEQCEALSKAFVEPAEAAVEGRE